MNPRKSQAHTQPTGAMSDFEFMEHLGLSSVDEAAAQLTDRELAEMSAAVSSLSCEVRAFQNYVIRLLELEHERRECVERRCADDAHEELRALIASDDLYCEDALESLWKVAGETGDSTHAFDLIATIKVLALSLDDAAINLH